MQARSKQIERQDARKQPAKERVKNFFEVALGLGREQAEREAGVIKTVAESVEAERRAKAPLQAS